MYTVWTEAIISTSPSIHEVVVVSFDSTSLTESMLQLERLFVVLNVVFRLLRRNVFYFESGLLQKLILGLDGVTCSFLVVTGLFLVFEA